MSNLLEQASLVMIPSGYKEDIVYSVIPTSGAGDLSFTRASNGTRINSAGLVEVVPWNLAQYSEDFSNAAWTKARVTITANDITAPNGTLTADKVSLNSGTNSKLIQQAYIQNGAFTQTVYAKAGTHNFIQLLVGSDATPYCNFDLVNGTYSASGCTASITSVGNGWFYLTMSYSTTIGTDYYLWAVDSLSSARADSTSSTGYYYVWGFQLNIGSTAKPYFPTTDRLNVPRLTYQNGGGGCPSLLLEKQSTNIVTYSEQIDNAAFTVATNNGTLTRTANYGTSPDGTQNADRLQMSITAATNNYSQLYQLLTVTSGQTYTWSVYIKSLSGTPTIGWAYDGSNWQNITVTTDWVRYTRTTTATSININADFLLYHNIGTSSSADILVWGYQIEQSSYPTSYIPTTSSSATRVADECFKTGISSLIGATEGVIFVDFNNVTNPEEDDYNMLATISDSANDYIYISKRNPTGIEIYGGAGASTYITSGVFVDGQRYKVAFAYKNNDFAVYINGSSIWTDTSGTINFTTPNKFSLGSYYSQILNFNSGINQTALFTTRLTNAELAQLTGNQNYTINQAYASYGVASESPNCVQP